MGVYAAVISGVISTGVKLLGSAGGPSYPSPPKMFKLPVQQAKNFMESYEAKRMQSGIDAWKKRFPLLYQGGKAEIDDIRANQQGKLSSTVRDTLNQSGLEAPKDSNQYKQALELGLNPITLAQRTSGAVTRQIAMNPEWTNKISGGTLASMRANANANQNAFTQLIGATNAAKSLGAAAQGTVNTQALIGGLTGAAGAAANYKLLNDPSLNLSTYYQGGYGSPVSPSTPSSAPVSFVQPQSTSSNFWSNSPSPNTPNQSNMYGNAYDFSGQALSDIFTPVPSSEQYQLNMGGSSY